MVVPQHWAFDWHPAALFKQVAAFTGPVGNQTAVALRALHRAGVVGAGEVAVLVMQLQ